MPKLDTTVNLKVGSTQIQKAYVGSTLVWQYAIPTSISLTSSTQSPVSGSAVTLTATVSGATSGTVNFRSGSALGPIVATVSGTAWSTTVYPTVSTTYYAEYVANVPYVGSTSAGRVITVYYPTVATLDASSYTINTGSSTTLTAGVDLTTAGSVEFRSGSTTGTIIATDTASPWSTVVAPTVTTNYYAKYLGSGQYLASSNQPGVTITVNYPTSISISASASTIVTGNSVVLTAYVTGAPSGTVNFRSGSPTGPIVATDYTGSPWQMTLYPTATTTYYAEYVANGNYLGSTSGAVTVTVNKITTTTSLSLSSTSINNGQSVTLTVTVSGATSGTVYIRSNSTAGTILATDSAAPWSITLSPTADVTYYAQFVEDATHYTSYSAGVFVNVKQLVTKTWSSIADWSQSYDGGSDPRNDGYLYYGYYSSTWGNQRSLIGFPVPTAVASSVAVTSVRFKFYNVHHYYSSGGSIGIGVHDYSSEPATWDGSRVDENLYTVTDAPKPGWVDLTLSSTFRDKFKAGNVGMSLGPGSSTSLEYYGYAAMHTSSTDPWLEIKYQVWE